MERKNVPATIDLFWVCKNCGALHKWPDNKARNYCNRRCGDAYQRKKKGSLRSPISN